ncbi:MAG: GNAT family N-acetyltransferase [Candidatus Magasanikbacteria bacterium]|nr:GNAT family N-acetyltransferase [Candidatus Magasanikbacteria bacterium]MBT4221436.1 GNAT family N-acetyltransferase [Candidatus Magasanikbacteria bacterium]MBT4350716.1 GNAT family N-acetyltransferase [Candidatus Magasanikbacteria bacterium]MBT4541608.1 GNAT family N-acetyltransferase [Candidatus Magasanikbacteria bacterium]MBT6252949.1 GNAT family N-acetyltransferase [Candidatus Magasanikbacteria bacterium]
MRFDNKIVTDLTDTSITSLYNQGYVFIRTTKGAMDQTRSVRIDLSVFEPSSENRRIIRKMTEQHITLQEIPLPYVAYHWEIGKMGKTFYDEKFGPKTFSANKIKEVLTNKAKSNFTTLFVYKQHDIPVGYCIVYQNEDMIHYSYPFYNEEIQNLGIGMMGLAIAKAKEEQKKHIYLGSAQRPKDIYKLQFKGLEWFDEKKWDNDLETLKHTLQI